MNSFKEIPVRILKGKDLPEGLRELPDPPSSLYVQGELPKEGIYLTVVGSRKHTSYGKYACETIIDGLKDFPFVIVSGLALGIDVIAHKKALDVGLPTIAIPGSGLDPSVIAPRTNYLIAEKILKQGGALVSEYEPMTKAAPYTFPRRNRIMAGLSSGVLIVEATKKSGTLITARLALDYNKTIFSIPGPITSPQSDGPNWLIKEGATPVTGAEDILETFGFETSTRKMSHANLSQEEEFLLGLLLEFQDKTTILKKSGWNVAQLNIITMSLELKGLIKDDGEILFVC